MADKITWVRPSGTEITTNGLPETIKFAAENGWVPKNEAKAEVKAEAPQADFAPRRGRPPKKDD